MKITIVGGGISGLSLAHGILRADSGADITVLESDRRAGGKIWTDSQMGYLCESGVNGYLDSKPATLELSKEIGIAPLRSNDASRIRYIYSRGTLQRLPDSPPSFIKSSLISWPGKLRLMAEPFIGRSAKEDETLADFGRRRLGAEAVERLIDPMASGVFAGNAELLSVRSCFPRIHELERDYGSLIRAMIKLTMDRKKEVSAAPSGKLTSYAQGMQEMVDALMKELGGRVRTASKCVGIAKNAEGYTLYLADGTKLDTEVAVLACPAHQAGEILRDMEPKVAQGLSGIPYPSLSVVCMGFKRADVNIDLNAFGYLVPSKEKRRILGTLFDTSIFPNRSPEGHVLLRSMAGGARAEEIADLEDGRLLDTVLTELKAITGLKAEPVFNKVYRHPMAIPQYNLGHGLKVAAVDALMARHPGLYVTGNAYKGVSVNDCITNSFAMAGRILEEAA